MASSIQTLVKTKVEQPGTNEPSEEHHPIMQSLLHTETELDSAACPASSIVIKHRAHDNAEKDSPLVRLGAVSVGGIASTHAFFNTENIDPRSVSASMALSIQSAAGLGKAKVGKRRSSRGSKKVPIKVFSADAANFMAMVHKLTGLQSAPSVFTGSPQMPLFKPLPARPSYPFMQGVYTPGASAFPAGVKVAANLSAADNGFANALSQLKSSLGQSRHLNSFNNASLATKQGLNAESSTKRFPPAIHNPSFKAAHTQVLQNSNSLGPSSGVALSTLWDPMKEGSGKEKSCTDTEMLNQVTSGEHHGIGSSDPHTRKEALNWEGLDAGEGGSLSRGLSSLPQSYDW